MSPEALASTSKAKPTTVIVVGGGATGIAQAVEHAEKGNLVYIVEDSPALNPHDLGDGASVALRRLEELKDGIRVITMADLGSVTAADGRFKIKLRKRASRVIAELCNSCDACSQVCPADISDERFVGAARRTAIDSPTPGRGGYSILKETPPCQESCPVHLDVRGYVGLAADGKYRESLALIRERLPFPGVIGRICTRPCETACNRGLADEPVAICALKRFVADWERAQPGGTGSTLKHEPVLAATGKKVAVIGSGPAGLSCAYGLARLGHDVTVFESLPLVGGMLRVGIPEYRLPRDVLDAEVSVLQKAGVKVRTGVILGKDVTIDGLLGDGYKAVFVAVGAHKGQRLGVQGEQGKGVIHGVDFLRELNLGKKPIVGNNVVVVGGGNVAIDSARSAKRLGAAKVSILYRRTRTEMPAHESEIQAASAEGIDIMYLVAPVEALLTEGKVRGLRCIRMELGAPDRAGRRTPVAVQGSEFDVEADMVIPAIGQAVDAGGLESSGVKLAAGKIAADQVTQATEREGVFAGGDAVTGPRSAIEAIAAGRRAATSIDRYLNALSPVFPRGGGDESEGKATSGGRHLKPYPDIPAKRAVMPETAPADRVASFTEAELGLPADVAQAEARRCLSCRGCLGCGLCAVVCKPKAIDFSQCDEEIDLEAEGIIITAGISKLAPALEEKCGQGKHPDLLTGPEFERMLSGAGLFKGMILRPSDGDMPERIALIVCDAPGTPAARRGELDYLSLHYAAKLGAAALAKAPVAKVVIVYPRLLEQGQEAPNLIRAYPGIQFVAGDIDEVGSAGNGNVSVAWSSGEGSAREEFGLVVLCTGFKLSAGIAEWSRKLGLEDGLFWPDGDVKTATTVDGVSLAGLVRASK